MVPTSGIGPWFSPHHRAKRATLGLDLRQHSASRVDSGVDHHGVDHHGGERIAPAADHTRVGGPTAPRPRRAAHAALAAPSTRPSQQAAATVSGAARPHTAADGRAASNERRRVRRVVGAAEPPPPPPLRRH